MKANAVKPELKPCPFCGADAELLSTATFGMVDGVERMLNPTKVACTDCGVSVECVCDDIEICHWNSRSESPAEVENILSGKSARRGTVLHRMANTKELKQVSKWRENVRSVSRLKLIYAANDAVAEAARLLLAATTAEDLAVAKISAYIAMACSCATQYQDDADTALEAVDILLADLSAFLDELSR